MAKIKSVILTVWQYDRFGGYDMRIKSEIHDKYTEIEVHVCNNKLNDKVKDVLQELHALYDDALTGTDERCNRCVL